MANFPTPSQIEQQYFQILRSIKPSINTNDKNSDFVIRGKAFTGLVSGLYGDQQKVNNDTYIPSARPEALLLRGQDLNIARQPATEAICEQVTFTGTNGTVIPIGTTLRYVATGVLYQTITSGTIALGEVDLQVEALQTGQIGNISAPDTLILVSPPSGVDTIATLVVDMADGTDIETYDSYRQRLLDRYQHPPSGGNEFDYPNFAFAADPAVRSAFIRRFGRGLGTVDVYITTGTTDIDTAVTQGLSIVRIPSGGLIDTVQAYYDSHVPLTDCPGVFAPSEVPANATVAVDLAAGLTLSSVPADAVYNPLNLTVQQLIQREVGRVMYKLPSGGRLIPGFVNGFLTASDIEEGLDVWLSAVKDPVTGIVIGKLPILTDRQCAKLDPPDYNLALAANNLVVPGTITVTLGT